MHGNCRVWRVAFVESAVCGTVCGGMCGECRVWGVLCVESSVCGEYHIWRVSCVESASSPSSLISLL